MADAKRPFEILLGDPLSKVARTERKTLLGVSAVGIVIAKSGLVPSKITALGIEFNQADQSIILRMLAWVVIYFLVAFLIYALADLLAWRAAFANARIDLRKAYLSLDAEKREEREIIDRRLRVEMNTQLVWGRFSSPVSLLRAVFEFAVPVVIGLRAVVVLLRTPPPRATLQNQTSSVVSNPAPNQPPPPASGNTSKAEPQASRDAPSK
jgi:hypothetical protein